MGEMRVDFFLKIFKNPIDRVVRVVLYYGQLKKPAQASPTASATTKQNTQARKRKGNNMTTKKITTAARLIDSEALNCSQFGNPRAKLWLELADGSHVIAKTATDAAAGYSVGNWRHEKARGCPWALIDCHITRTGSVIVDCISEGVGAYTATAAEHLI